jgi:hypothetical protein
MTAVPNAQSRPNERLYFRNLITVMALILISGFVVQLAMGRSSFSAPLVVHVHAFVFMGWVGLTLTQAWLIAGDDTAQHRKVGILALVWAGMMVIMGTLVTIEAVRTLRTPFFFQPQHFLIVNPLTLWAFAGLLIAAVALRHRPDWHARLHVGAFMLLMGPGIGRLAPAPLMMPYAFEITALLGLAFIAAGMWRDHSQLGRVHPAWGWSIGVLVGVLAIGYALAHSVLGANLFALVAHGSPAADINGMAFPPPPPMP